MGTSSLGLLDKGQVSAEGEVLLWSGHDLVEILVARRSHEFLKLEPSLSALAVDGDDFRIEACDAEGLRWSWDQCDEVVLSWFAPDFGRRDCRISSTKPAFVSWSELDEAEEVELLPLVKEEPGLTRLLVRPEIVVHFKEFFDSAVIEVALPTQIRGSLLVATFRRSVESGFYEDSSAVALEARGENQITYNTTLRLGANFRGILVVYHEYQGRRRFLSARGWSNQCLRGPADAETCERLRVQLEPRFGSYSVGKSWPLKARQKLQYYLEQTGWAFSAKGPLPWKGLFRATLLRNLGLAAPPFALEDLLGFQEGSLTEAMGRLKPGLGNALRRNRNTACQIWLIENSDLSDLAELAGQGTSPRELQRAALRADLKKRTEGILSRIRQQAPEVSKLSEQLRDLGGPDVGKGSSDQATDEALRGWQKNLRLFEEALQREDLERTIRLDGKAPLSPDKYLIWAQSLQARFVWRSKLDSILVFCETGKWPSGATQNAEELLSRIAKLKLPASAEISPQLRDSPMKQELEAVLDHIESKANGEDQVALRVAARELAGSVREKLLLLIEQAQFWQELKFDPLSDSGDISLGLEEFKGRLQRASSRKQLDSLRRDKLDGIFTNIQKELRSQLESLEDTESVRNIEGFFRPSDFEQLGPLEQVDALLRVAKEIAFEKDRQAHEKATREALARTELARQKRSRKNALEGLAVYKSWYELLASEESTLTYLSELGALIKQVFIEGGDPAALTSFLSQFDRDGGNQIRLDYLRLLEKSNRRKPQHG